MQQDSKVEIWYNAGERGDDGRVSIASNEVQDYFVQAKQLILNIQNFKFGGKISIKLSSKQ